MNLKCKTKIVSLFDTHWIVIIHSFYEGKRGRSSAASLFISAGLKNSSSYLAWFLNGKLKQQIFDSGIYLRTATFPEVQLILY